MLESVKYVLPEIYLVIIGLVVLLQGMFIKSQQKAFKKTFYTSFLGLLAILGIYIFAVPKFVVQEGFSISGGENLFVSYNFIIYIKILIITCSLMILFMIKKELNDVKNLNFENYFIFIFLVVGILISLSSFNLIIIFTGIELLSFSLYFLLGSIGQKKQKIKAVGRYFVISSLATALLLFGISLMFLSCHSVDMGTVGKCLSETGGVHNFKQILAFVFILSGLLIKLGVFPFQYYLPDIAKRTNKAVLASILTIVKIAILMILFHLIIITGISKQILLLGLIISSIGVISSSIFCYREENLDRFIAFSSIHNTSFVLVGIVLSDYKIFIFYQTLYIFLILGILSFLSSFSIKGKSVRTLKDLSGAIKDNTFYKLVTFAVLSFISGLPPVGMFLGKFLVVKTLIEKEQYFFAIIMAIGGVMMVGCFLKLMRELFVYLSQKNNEKVSSYMHLKVISYALILLSLGVSFLLFVF